MTKVDYKSYTFFELQEALENVNRELYPQNYSLIIQELKNKKPEGIEIIEEAGHIKILEADMIPRFLGNKHSIKEIELNPRNKKYNLKKIFIISLMFVGIYFWLDLNMESYLGFKIPSMIFLLILPVSYLLRSFEHIFYGPLIFIFMDDHIVLRKKGKETKYYLNNLDLIIIERDIESKYDNIFFIWLKFNKDGELFIKKIGPEFEEIKNYLNTYLSQRLNVTKYLGSGSYF